LISNIFVTQAFDSHDTTFPEKCTEEKRIKKDCRVVRWFFIHTDHAKIFSVSSSWEFTKAHS